MRMIRVKTKCGEERLASLGNANHCAAWWHNVRMSGGVHGDAWCCPYDNIAFAEIIDITMLQDDSETADERPRSGENLAGVAQFPPHIAAAIAAGIIKPQE
jgi:hypothetical protein